MSKTYNKDYFEDRKLKYEKNHGVFIHAFMFTEFSNRILGQCNVALNDLQRQLDEEISRAKAEEARLDQKIDTETNRAKAEEVRLDGKIDSETSRATAEETRLDGKIDAETARATAEETRLGGKIDTEKTRLDGKIDEEITRAKAEETRLDGKIDSETSRATGEENRLNGKIDTEKNRIDRLDGTQNAIDSPDFNTLTTSGIYMISQPNHGQNYPIGDWGVLRVENAHNSRIVQTYYTDREDGATYQREYIEHSSNANKVWRPWKKLAYIDELTIDWSHINNRPEMDKQALDNLNLNLTTLRQAYMDLKARVDKLDGGAK